jgi:enhancing lycopene biosynthesis protein 2
MKIGLLLSGCGVYDGAEIQESVLSLLAIAERGHEVTCIGVDKNQHHVMNHLNGEEMNEKRNMLTEAARIARGEIIDINQLEPADIDMLVIPGGFGSAKNFTSWAFEGPSGSILPEIKLLLVNLINIGKPIVALCVSPVVVAKALEDKNIELFMTLGSNEESSPYDIDGFSQGLQATGVKAVMKTKSEVLVDEKNKVVTAPCYMMDTDILTLRKNIQDAILAAEKLV